MAVIIASQLTRLEGNEAPRPSLGLTNGKVGVLVAGSCVAGPPIIRLSTLWIGVPQQETFSPSVADAAESVPVVAGDAGPVENPPGGVEKGSEFAGLRYN